MMKNFSFMGIICLILFYACTVEQITPEDDTIEKSIEETIDKESVQYTPCDFDFTSVLEGDTLNIACSHDLKGENIFLPTSVVVNYYNGGELLNGDLFFEEGGKIDGRLLNHQLEVTGEVTLLESTFLFEKEKWNITEGVVSDEVALENKNSLENIISQAKALGANEFHIDALDAYFLVSKDKNHIPSAGAAISIPSNYSIIMTDYTHLRVQPNKYKEYALLGIRDVSNVNISGGHLYGDRDEHDYSSIKSTHEFGYLIGVYAGKDIEFDGVSMYNATGDGILVASIGFTFNPDYNQSRNITIKNCLFDSNRRNNLSLTDGTQMIVENNTFLNAGVDTPNSKGVLPRCGLDVEAHRERDANGNLVLYQEINHVTIKNNIEKGSANLGILVYIGQEVVIENNTSNSGIAFSFGNGIEIKNNIINAIDKSAGIIGGTMRKSETIFNNKIYGNTIKGSSLGINLYNQDVKVYDNTITDCITGIKISDLKDAEVYDNKINSNEKNCYGIFSHISNADNVLIRKNKIAVNYKPIAFVNVNIKEGHENSEVLVTENDLNGGNVTILNSNGIIVNQ